MPAEENRKCTAVLANVACGLNLAFGIYSHGPLWQFKNPAIGALQVLLGNLVYYVHTSMYVSQHVLYWYGVRRTSYEYVTHEYSSLHALNTRECE